MCGVLASEGVANGLPAFGAAGGGGGGERAAALGPLHLPPAGGARVRDGAARRCAADPGWSLPGSTPLLAPGNISCAEAALPTRFSP